MPGVLGPGVAVDARHPSPGKSAPLPEALEKTLASLAGKLLAVSDLDGDGAPEILVETPLAEKTQLALSRWDGEKLVKLKASVAWSR
jgi:hypothetical protein